MPDEPKNVLNPMEMGAVLLATLVVFLFFAFITVALGETTSLFIGEVIMIIPAIVFISLRRLSILETFRFKRITFSQMLATLFVFIPLFILIDELDRIIQVIFPMPPELMDALINMMSFDSPAQVVTLILAGVVVAALAEEMLFRGLLQNTLEHFRDPAMAIVSSAVFFALVHFNPWTSIQILLLGLVLGWVTWKTQSIVPSILLHGMNNLFSLLMINAGDGSLDWYARGDHVNWMWLVIALIVVVPAFRFFTSQAR